MEPQGLVSDAWSFLDPSMAAEEESEVMVHLFGPYENLNDQEQENSGIGVQPVFWSDYSADNSYHSEYTNYNPYSWSQGNGNNGASSNNINFLHSFSGAGDLYLNDANLNFSVPDEQSSQMSMPPFQVGSCPRSTTEAFTNEETSSDEIAEPVEEPAPVLPTAHSLQNMKRRLNPEDAKKPAAQEERDGDQLGSKTSAQVRKKGKNGQSKRHQKSASGSNGAESNADMNAQSSSCYSSEHEELDAPNGAGATSSSSKGSNLNGKARAGRGSATDPQSLYARKRRERINERLRILQNIVPNGTKVDISTMLEEAVQYVKFLQLQIKFLSSDEMWMYAPIAYNGMNLGIDLKISAPLQLAKGGGSTVDTQSNAEEEST